MLQARWKAGQRSGDWSDFQLIETSNYVSKRSKSCAELKLNEWSFDCGSEGFDWRVSRVAEDWIYSRAWWWSSAGRKRLSGGRQGSMPARWCSLSVEARQNPVRIQSLVSIDM